MDAAATSPRLLAAQWARIGASRLPDASRSHASTAPSAAVMTTAATIDRMRDVAAPTTMIRVEGGPA